MLTSFLRVLCFPIAGTPPPRRAVRHSRRQAAPVSAVGCNLAARARHPMGMLAWSSIPTPLPPIAAGESAAVRAPSAPGAHAVAFTASLAGPRASQGLPGQRPTWAERRAGESQGPLVPFLFHGDLIKWQKKNSFKLQKNDISQNKNRKNAK